MWPLGLEKVGILFGILFFYVKRKREIVTLHNVLSFVALNNICLLVIPHQTSSSLHLHKLISQVTCCFPLSSLPSVCAQSVKFFKLSVLIMSCIMFSFLFLIVLFVFILSSFLLKFSVAHIFNIWHPQHPSVVPRLCCLVFSLSVQC